MQNDTAGPFWGDPEPTKALAFSVKAFGMPRVIFILARVLL